MLFTSLFLNMNEWMDGWMDGWRICLARHNEDEAQQPLDNGILTPCAGRAALEGSTADQEAAGWLLGCVMAEAPRPVLPSVLAVLAELLDCTQHNALGPSDFQIYATPPGTKTTSPKGFEVPSWLIWVPSLHCCPPGLMPFWRGSFHPKALVLSLDPACHPVLSVCVQRLQPVDASTQSWSAANLCMWNAMDAQASAFGAALEVDLADVTFSSI